MRKHVFRVVMAFLIVVLCVVSFYMLWVHVPYYNYHHQLDEIRNEICEKNHYEYMDYFNEHRGKDKYYILKVKINGVDAVVAYDKDLKLVNLYQGAVALKEDVFSSMMKKYPKYVLKDDFNHIEIGYENNKFVYTLKIQRDDMLVYLYYDLVSGEFVKTYHIENHG